MSEVAQKYFKCDRIKPECNRVRNCRFDKKPNGSNANSQEVVAEKFCMMKEEINKHRSGKVIRGSSYTLKGEVIPS